MARHPTPDFRDRVEHFAFASLLRFLRSPNVSRGQSLGRGMGRLIDTVSPVRRKDALENLAHAFPERTEKECEALLRGMWASFGQTVAEFARFGGRTPAPLADLVYLQNAEAFSEAHRRGKGALLLTAHYGNWELLGAAIAAHGYPVTVLAARQRNPLVEKLLSDYRGAMSLPCITVGDSLRPILKALRAGSFVATIADQDGGRGGFFIDFLGRKASVQAGLFRLIARKGVPLVTGFALREGNRWRGELQAPVWPRPVSGEQEVEEEAYRLAALYVGRVEDYVRRQPDHWFWIHRRWRTRPPEAESTPARTAAAGSPS